MQAAVDYIALGRRIRTARNKKNMTQQKLAELCNLSVSHIGHIERGSRILSVDVLFGVAKVLQVSTDYLLFDSTGADAGAFLHIAEILKRYDKSKVRRYMAAVRALTDKIDEL